MECGLWGNMKVTPNKLNFQNNSKLGTSAPERSQVLKG